MRRSEDLSRRRPRREPLPRVLIVCEGQCTEKGYFNHLRHAERIPVHLIIEGGGTPKRLVERAVELKNEADANARRSGDPNLRFDQVWCVFDIDEHPFVSDAKQQARDNGISVGVSNPCFELWVLLHFRKQTAHIERRLVQHACREYLPGYEKHLPGEKLLPRYPEALQRARDLESWQAKRDNAGANPSTNVYHFVEMIKSFRKP